MLTKTYLTDTVEQAGAVLEAWKNIDPALTIGDPAQFGAIFAQIDSFEA